MTSHRPLIVDDGLIARLGDGDTLLLPSVTALRLLGVSGFAEARKVVSLIADLVFGFDFWSWRNGASGREGAAAVLVMTG